MPVGRQFRPLRTVLRLLEPPAKRSQLGGQRLRLESGEAHVLEHLGHDLAEEHAACLLEQRVGALPLAGPDGLLGDLDGRDVLLFGASPRSAAAGSILSPDEQQLLAKGVIGAFLQRSLFDMTEYDAFFRDPQAWGFTAAMSPAHCCAGSGPPPTAPTSSAQRTRV